MRRYARIDESSSVVEFITLEDDQDITEMFHPSLIWVEIPSGVNPDYGWTWSPAAGFAPPVPTIDYELLSLQARSTRDSLLLNVYDRGVMMVMREQRRTDPSDTVRVAWLAAKLVELDDYAVALQDIPEQPDFPVTIVWPVQPTGE